jgi:hypothetical protein
MSEGRKEGTLITSCGQLGCCFPLLKMGVTMWKKSMSPFQSFYVVNIMGGNEIVTSEINGSLLLRQPVLQKLDGRYDIACLTIETI